mmetsp:Transcript_39122/g.92026  ORF Transcript_39122/g.92026 Transcript_39122/m.92026 type:complete len:328 (-) Transcript_39122:154-1137(-)|eukprot:CAMPEP_0178408206 /NCGR_PEP_ID=MMETSP0689_2-20121128/19820_1 /TAXON_ID=160604 /ORGANISM="Amphidinium massartii, Strain CS-259" /LENGTH=327 /DNA_ID=CAMNT_0020029295 /DNA_START=82 /DNA_END=1065 /DNA_ORIENTATION=+
MAYNGSAVAADALRSARLEEVATSSRQMLESSVLSTNQATSSFQVQRATCATKSNTFLNFLEVEPALKKRSASFDFGSMSHATEEMSCSWTTEHPISTQEDPELIGDLGVAVEKKRLDKKNFLSSCSTYAESACSSTWSSATSCSTSTSPCSNEDPFTLAIFARLQQFHGASEPEDVVTGAEQPQVSEQVEVDHELVESIGVAVNTSGRNVTTMMLQNLPRIFLKQDLLDALDDSGFAGLYDYVHVSYSFSSGICLGYAFINFKNTAAAEEFMASWNGSGRFLQRRHRKTLLVSEAVVQGLEALMAQPSMKKLMKVKNAAFRPYLLQ